MKSRRQGPEEPLKFLGVSIQEEQEVVSIIVPREIKKKSDAGNQREVRMPDTGQRNYSLPAGG